MPDMNLRYHVFCVFSASILLLPSNSNSAGSILAHVKVDFRNDHLCSVLCAFTNPCQNILQRQSSRYCGNRAQTILKSPCRRKYGVVCMDGREGTKRSTQFSGTGLHANQDFANLLSSDLYATIYGDNSFAKTDSMQGSTGALPFVYNWKRPRAVNVSRVPVSLAFSGDGILQNDIAREGLDFDKAHFEQITKRSDSTISKLSKELEDAKAEHRDINVISDQLACKSQYGGGIQYQVAALKKRKLVLKDRIRQLEGQLETLLRQSILSREENEENTQAIDPLGASLSDMMRKLRSMGLKPEEVPPHKDSFFLSLMKALQRAGLRPNGYDFREGSVMGSERQFPFAAKKAKFEVLKLLSSQADKLNGIGGWKLSPEEFKRYFSKAWWTVPAARDDLFMASAHLYSVRLVVFSIEAEGLDEQVYDPPEASARATLYLCRRQAHVISTVLINKPATPVATRPNISMPATRAPPPPVDAATPLTIRDKVKKKGGSRVSEVGKDELDAGLGLLEEVLDSPTDDAYFQAEGEESGTGEESVQDDEVVQDRQLLVRPPGSLYEPAVRTRRVFVAITLCGEARVGVEAAAEALRRNFPLDKRLLDDVMRWVDPESYHVTLHTLDLMGPGAVERACAAVAHAVRVSGQAPFRVRTGGVGSFWRSAGSGWGRVPRVVWLGLEGQGVAPLLRLHETLGECLLVAPEAQQDQCSVKCAAVPFCAHITLGKTRHIECLAGDQRRALRVLAKWVQDPSRPVALHQLLMGANPSNTALSSSSSSSSHSRTSPVSSSVSTNSNGGGRGSKRERSWMLRAQREESLSGRQKQRLHKLLRKEGRDLGALNAEIAAALVAARAPASSAAAMADESRSESISGNIVEEAGGEGGWDSQDSDGETIGDEEAQDGLDILVEALSVVEAVPVPGSGRVRYVTLQRIPLVGGT